MTNLYLPDEADLLPGELARSYDINLRYSNTISGFDLLPDPLGSGQKGFSDPVPVGTPTANTHAVTKIFAETTLVNAAEIAALAYIQPTLATHLAETTALRDQAAASETAAATSATDSQTSADASEASNQSASNYAFQSQSNYETLRDRFLGPSSTAPSTNDTGGALIDGTVYYNTTLDRTYVYYGSEWHEMATPMSATAARNVYVATAGQTTFATSYYPGEVDVWLNGIKLQISVDFTAATGNSITLLQGAAADDVVEVLGFESVALADLMTEAQSETYIDGELAADLATHASNVATTIATAQTDIATMISTAETDVDDVLADVMSEADTIAYLQTNIDAMVANGATMSGIVDDAVSDAILLDIGI